MIDNNILMIRVNVLKVLFLPSGTIEPDSRIEIGISDELNVFPEEIKSTETIQNDRHASYN